MAWNDRITEAAYTSPSGVRTVFVYENVSEEFEKKTTGFEFAASNKTFVQDLGRTGRRLPLRMFFTGDDYDVRAATFSDSIGETGIGSLEHPIYGTFDVVPFGTIRRRDDLKTEANQAVFEIDFWETTRLVFPLGGISALDNALAAIDTAIDAGAEGWATGITSITKIEETSLQSRFEAQLAVVRKALQPVANFQAEVESQFNAVFGSVNAAIDTLIRDPLTLAFQAQILVRIPAQSTALIADRLVAYNDLLGFVVGNVPLYALGLNNEPTNSFLTDELFGHAALLGASSAAINNEYLTRGDALSAADTLLDQLDTFNTWRDNNFKSLSVVDTGETYQPLINAVNSTAAFLVEISFTLRQERSIFLDRARTPVDLTAELYGGFGERDELLDFLIDSNRLVGLDILEVPQGREVVYYT